MKRKPRAKMASFKLSSPARGALRRVSKKQGWTKTRTLEIALVNLECGKVLAGIGAGKRAAR